MSTASVPLRAYALVTAGYWAFTVTDGALRMLVLLYFHELGYSPVALAFLFLLYEVTGIATNLVGGWVGARRGLNRTLIAGLGLQVIALSGLSLHDRSWPELTSVGFVMAVQALSGVAKDLTKMSSKSTVKLVAGDGSLFKFVAVLTGSKNALKGVGFFVGAALLGAFGYRTALLAMAAALTGVLIVVTTCLQHQLGVAKSKAPLRSVWTKSPAINRLSAARVFLFGSRDIWFVVALPVFLTDQLGWSFEGTGAFLAAWVIGYGFIQSVAPRLIGSDRVVGARLWSLVLAAVTALIASLVQLEVAVSAVVIVGLVAFGAIFAVNSSLHSYLILAYSERDDDVATDVGFYYSANALGRLIGTLLSGTLALWGGLEGALWGSAVFLALTWMLSLRLPRLALS